jgi:hypothetical protein
LAADGGIKAVVSLQRFKLGNEHEREVFALPNPAVIKKFFA